MGKFHFRKLRDDLKKISKRLENIRIGNVVIAEANCCLETDLCDTFDRKTKCIDDKNFEGIDKLISFNQKNLQLLFHE